MQLLDHYIDRVKNLPPAPTVAVELLDLLNDPNNNVDRFVGLVRHDPSLTAGILKRCNSAYFSGDEPAVDMFEVISRLGFYEVYCEVASLTGAKMMALGRPAGGLDIDHLWRHSVVAAVAASKVAKQVEESESVAFTAGLLHDIGKLVLGSVEGRPYTDLVRQTETAGTNLRIAEEAAFGLNHAAVGARLLVRWGLPDNIALAVRHHHSPPGFSKPCQRLNAVVQIANDLAHLFAETPLRGPAFSSCHPTAMIGLGLTADDIPGLLAKIQIGLARVQGFSMQNFDPAI